MRIHIRAIELIVLFLFSSIVLWIITLAPLRDTFENIALYFNPTAERAFEYGERHFSASDPADYDINRAEYFFYKAAALDPRLPYVYHELARISFLHGDFAKAMVQINLQIANQGDHTPNSYYIRALIEGYNGDYVSSAKDYEHFLQFDPHDWAAINDYAWVLLKANHLQQAASVTARGVRDFPDNPWLLNTYATALYEVGNLEAAGAVAQVALHAASRISEPEWLHAYPGNDPRTAAEGIAAFQKAVLDNIHSISVAEASSTLQLKKSHE